MYRYLNGSYILFKAKMAPFIIRLLTHAETMQKNQNT